MFNLFKTKKLTKHTRKSNIETKREKIILNSFVIYLSMLQSKTYKLITFKSVDLISIQVKKIERPETDAYYNTRKNRKETIMMQGIAQPVLLKAGGNRKTGEKAKE